MIRMSSALGGFLAALVLAALLTPLTALAAGDAKAGKKTYEMLCFTCHGMTGKGDGPAGQAIRPPPRDFSAGEFKFDANNDGNAGTDADLALVIKNGAGAYGGNVMMAPWGHLSDGEVQNLIAYIRSLKK